MAFLPYDPNLRQRLQPAPAPADDWHAQWGVPPEASGPGGGSVPFDAGASSAQPGGFSQYRMDPTNEYRPFTPLSQLGRGGGMGAPMPSPATATGPMGGPGALVLLRAPNGQTKQVPGDQVAHYLARGATRG